MQLDIKSVEAEVLKVQKGLPKICCDVGDMLFIIETLKRGLDDLRKGG